MENQSVTKPVNQESMQGINPENKPHGYIDPSLQKRPQSYTVNNIIALIFVALVLIEWFLPVDFTFFTSLPTLIFSVVAGISFANRVRKLTKQEDTPLRYLGIVVGVLGGIFIFLVGLFSALIGALKGIHI